MPGAFQSGLGGQFMVAKETTWGTPVTPNKSFEIRSEGIKLNKNFLRSQQLRAGRMFQSSSRRIATTRGAAGPVVLEVPNQGFGVILDQLHGNVVTPVQQGATAAYLQTHDIGTTDPSSKSLTVQAGRPSTDGTVRPFTYPGSKVMGATFRCAIDEFLVCELNLDAKDEDTATSLATFAPPSNLASFTFVEGAITVDGSPAGIVTSLEIPITYAYKADRYSLGSATRSQHIVNGYPTIEPKISVEWKDLTLYNKWVTGNGIAAVVADFVGPIIASTFAEEIKFNMPACGLLGDTPTLDGPDILTQDIPLEVLDNGTNAPLTITYMSRDLTL